MDVDRLLQLARTLIDDLTFCVAATEGEDGHVSARIIQPLPLEEDWTVNTITNRRCRKVREVERFGRMTLLYQHDKDKSYVCLVGRAEVVEDVELKRSIWKPGHYRWNPKGPDDRDTVFVRLATERIELWSAVHEVLPPPEGYSAAVLLRDNKGWRYSATEAPRNNVRFPPIADIQRWRSRGFGRGPGATRPLARPEERSARHAAIGDGGPYMDP